MRAVPAILMLVSLLLLAPLPALAANPTPMAFNGQASANVRGPVQFLAMDGPGHWAAVAVGDAPLSVSLTEDQDLFVYNLNSQTRAWEARDDDALNEGGRLVAVANGTSGNPGDWLVLVNNTVSPVLTAYRTSGFGGGVLGRMVWQHFPPTGSINAVDISADSSLIGLATGEPAQNKTYTLLRNRFEQGPPRELFRFQIDGTATNVTRFTSVALSINSTVPTFPANRSVYSVVGAETLSTNLVRGAVYVFETTFNTPDLDRPGCPLSREGDARCRCRCR